MEALADFIENGNATFTPRLNYDGSGYPQGGGPDFVHFLLVDSKAVSYTHLTLPTKRIV